MAKGADNTVDVNLIFVYGTLMQKAGRSAFRGMTEYVCESSIKGYQIYDLGWYPGIRHTGNDRDEVVGELHSIPVDRYDEVINALDQYEGEGNLYLRKTVDVELDSGVYVKAWVYVYNNEPRSAPLQQGRWPAARGMGGHAVTHQT